MSTDKHRWRVLVLSVFICVYLWLPFRLHAADHVLWYLQPATKWNAALPIGNGRLGAMIFGGVDEEHLQLNDNTVWAGEKRDRINPEAAKALPEVQRLL